ncbi:hypothetical protein [Paracidovorax cattleyae]|uniref:hypothetical protein n=1 Tax=Paracidovorax cattleyae TaxID=80868 RepID=UPI000D164B72|nr:hypothetical protein [Paracidovorax cattleyae]AVS74718.1 hypothetical protein C8240_12505 [Paracidovorax cattleyae]
MSAPQASTAAETDFRPALGDLHATPEQRKILERIALQRERLHSRGIAQRQAADLRAQQGAEGAPRPLDPDAPLLERVVWFARHHPIVVVAAAGAAAAVGPSRIIRWAGVVMPIIMKMKR